jgi:phosphoglycolate phosphatase
MKLVIYDLDGTLIDSALIVQSIINQMRREQGRDPIDKEKLIPWLSLGGEDLISNSLEVSGAELNRCLGEFRDRYYETPTPVKSVYVGAMETLERLHQLNIKLAICTNKPRKLADKVLTETGLFDKFSFISAGGDLPTKKPDPRNIELCFKGLSTAPKASIMVGDSTIDQRLAKLAGVPFIQYAPGYDDGVIVDDVSYKINHHLEILNFFKLQHIGH